MVHRLRHYHQVGNSKQRHLFSYNSSSLTCCFVLLSVCQIQYLHACCHREQKHAVLPLNAASQCSSPAAAAAAAALLRLLLLLLLLGS